jgi:hypothetical protein
MVYVACDACGSPAGGEGDLADKAQEARLIARSLGFVRVKGRDYCGSYVHGCGATGP